MLAINYNNTDLSLKLEEYAAPTVDISLLVGEYIYIGYHKPISNVYVELTNSVNSLSTLKVEYEKSSGFTDVSNLVDRTNGLGNSGRISFEIDAKTAVQSTRFGLIRYWIRLSVDIGTGSREYVGINVLFSDDKDLSRAYPGIESFLPQGATSFVNFHEESRKDIVQELRKAFSSNGKLLTQFDLLDNEEVREVSKYLTLSKIFGWLSDNTGDKWEQRQKEYETKAYGILSTVSPTVDTNDNGEKDAQETPTVQFVRVVRV